MAGKQSNVLKLTNRLSPRAYASLKEAYCNARKRYGEATEFIVAATAGEDEATCASAESEGYVPLVRLGYLGQCLDQAKTFSPDNCDRVDIGVNVTFLENAERHTIHIGGEDLPFLRKSDDEGDIPMISTGCVLGKALLGKQEGAKLKVSTPKGQLDIEILSIWMSLA